MLRQLLTCGFSTLTLAAVAGAQEARVYRSEPGQARAFTLSTTEDRNRAVIGVTTASGSARDTLGVLLGSVTPGGPADKAGIEEGSRVASINGVNLKLDRADVGEWDMAGMMTRRFTREMAKVKAGDEVELRIYNSGQTRTVKVKTVTYEDLYDAGRREQRREADERAALGVSLGSGSKRDTLGVLLIGIEDDSPAAKAGLEEGNRIQAINGVDLRVSREDAGDAYISNSMVRRLQRELEKVKVGDEVTLKVYVGGGRTRDVRVKTVAQSDLRRGGAMSIFRTAPMGTPFDLGIEMRDLEGRLRSIAPTPRIRMEDAPRIRLEQRLEPAAGVVRSRVVM